MDIQWNSIPSVCPYSGRRAMSSRLKERSRCLKSTPPTVHPHIPSQYSQLHGDGHNLVGTRGRSPRRGYRSQANYVQPLEQ